MSGLRRRGLPWVLPGLLVWALAGCAAGPAQARHSGRERVAWYLPNRLVDFAEVLRAGVTVGPGAGADLRCTRYFQLAALHRYAVGTGWVGRGRNNRVYGEQNYVAFGPWRAASETDPACTEHFTEWELRLEVQAALVGFNLALDPEEALDLFSGFLSLDPMGDDYGVPPGAGAMRLYAPPPSRPTGGTLADL